MEYFNKNISGHNDWEESFIGQLLECHTWNRDEFWRLHADITVYITTNADSGSLPRHIAGEFSRLVYLIMLMYAAHYDPQDVYRIEGVNEEELTNFIERVEWLSQSYFNGNVPNESEFYEQNPYLKNA